MQIEYRKLSELKAYKNNTRTHSPEQVAQISASITEFGFTNPLLIKTDGEIIAGHGRLMGAEKAGLDAVPCIALDHLTDEQARALVIADNQLAMNAGWDEDLLSVELKALQDSGFGLDVIGFDESDLERYLSIDDGESGLTDEDAVPPLQEASVSARGDIWSMGGHRVMCGDSTDSADVGSLMAGVMSDLVFTDPPYGMSYGGGRARGDHAKNKNGGVLIKAHGMIKGDDLQGDELLKMVADSISNADTNSKKGAAAYICFTWRTYSEFYAALATIGLEPKSCIVWDKKSIGLGNSNYRPQHEFIFYCKGEWMGDKSQSDVWSMSRDHGEDYVHPTQKPVELIEKALRNSSKQGDLVHDCFGGSGSTLIACEKTGRYARLMELDEKYADVIVRRWQDYTGENAVRESDGMTFNEAAQNV